MKLGKGVPSVWPGYVAAIASLVLSLLLLLAILVFAMAQVGEIVARYKPQIMLDAVQDELMNAAAAVVPAGAGKSPPPVARPQADPGPRSPVSSVQGGSPQRGAEMDEGKATRPMSTRIMPQPVYQDIRLIFEAGVSDLSGEEAREFEKALGQLPQTTDSVWLISAAVLDKDMVNDKTTYRLMLQIRQILLRSGIALQKIQLRLLKMQTPPPGSEKGEIVITIKPLIQSASEGVRP